MTIFKHRLGDRAKCRLTGFEGIIISRCEFITGCNRYALQPTSLIDGKIQEAVYFDEEMITVIRIY